MENTIETIVDVTFVGTGYVKVVGTTNKGNTVSLFNYYSDELSFTKAELIGKLRNKHTNSFIRKMSHTYNHLKMAQSRIPGSRWKCTHSICTAYHLGWCMNGAADCKELTSLQFLPSDFIANGKICKVAKKTKDDSPDARLKRAIGV